jgi:Quinohemoprotein amine dehydrogenase, alpha subunit domain III
MKTSTHSATQCCEGSCQGETVCRPRYFPRQIITPDDLTLEQEYFRSRLRWHNLMLHGWGVVCGARVCPKRNDDGKGYVSWTVVVERGYAIGPCGDEIILDCPRTVDLRTPGVTGVTGDPCVEPVDPWCSDVYEAPDEDTVLFVAVRYKETRTRPIRVQPAGCGCDDSRCEYSRWCDSYEIGVLRECPTARVNPTNGNGKSIPACPDPATSPWLGLAEVAVSTDGVITRIDNCSCRRLVRGFAEASWQCTSANFTIGDFRPTEVKAGEGATIVVPGSGFVGDMTADFGPGVVVEKIDATPLEATIRIKVDADARRGPRPLVLAAPDCSVATAAEAITINGGPQRVAPTPRVGPAPKKRRAPARPEPPEPAEPPG